MKNLIGIIFSTLLVTTSLSAQDDPYAARRDKIFDIIGEDIAIIKNSGRDYTMQMSVNWNYYYLTGDDTEDGMLVLFGSNKAATLYRPKPQGRNQLAEIEGLESKALSDFESDLSGRIFRAKTLWIDFSSMVNLENLGQRLASVQDIKNIAPSIYQMRSIKDDHELELLIHAINSTADGLVEVMKAAEPGMNEKDFELILKYKFETAGCENLGFGIQAASGPNSTSVHYGANDRQTEPGDMMVFDVGARYGYYSADISRSFPVSGKFTKEQKEIYQIVLDAQKAAIAEFRPGGNIDDANQKATEALAKGLLKLGLLTDLDKSWQEGFWIQHGFFHPIGLVVHDVGGFPNDLEPGMIVTVEPGLYFPLGYFERSVQTRLRGVSEAEKDAFIKAVKPVLEKYINIGVRIEDDVLVTEDGNKVISAGVPKEIDEIEALMKAKSMFNK